MLDLTGLSSAQEARKALDKAKAPFATRVLRKMPLLGRWCTRSALAKLNALPIVKELSARDGYYNAGASEQNEPIETMSIRQCVISLGHLIHSAGGVVLWRHMGTTRFQYVLIRRIDEDKVQIVFQEETDA